MKKSKIVSSEFRFSLGIRNLTIAKYPVPRRGGGHRHLRKPGAQQRGATGFYLRKALGKEFMSFTVPWTLYEEMEANVPESFLTRYAWKTMMEGNEQ